MRLLLLFLLLFPLLALAQEADIPPLPEGEFLLKLELRDSVDASLLSLQTIGFNAKTADDSVSRTLQLVNGSAGTYLDYGYWNVTIEANNAETPGSDYYAFLQLNVSNDSVRKVYMQAVASLQGMVVDDQGKAVSGAKVSAECVSSLYGPAGIPQAYSNEFGSFLLKTVPAGNCRLLASANEKVGSVDLRLEKGELKNAEIRLAQQIAVRQDNLLLYGAGALLLVAFLYLYYSKMLPRKRKGEALEGPAAVERQERKIARTHKMDSVIRTLNENERKIVEFLIESNGEGTQSKLYHRLLIPKVSLSRAVYSLEQRNIVKTEKFGKLKKVELTDWFRS